ncbi:MAG TPA: hypothetical protein VHC42_12125 [Rhizomicrobium sp.]|nr:hypothetical protein [Rhizomicrobium sp.]
MTGLKIRRQARAAPAIAALVAWIVSTPAIAHRPLYVSVDKGSTETFLTAINTIGQVAGFSNSTAFIREPDGSFTEFALDGYGLWPTSISGDGWVAGFAFHGADEIAFVRDADGDISTFSPAGATKAHATAINASHSIAGIVSDADMVLHGFVRAPDGAITTFDPDGSLETVAAAINDAGAIAGSYYASGAYHGFIRDPGGTITSFDAPGASNTHANAMNDAGWIAGACEDATGQYGFLRSPDGAIVRFGSAAERLDAHAINDNGVITGVSKGARGFIRKKNGNLVLFRVPGEKIRETSGAALNDDGIVVGTYYQVTGYHVGKQVGFIRTP